MKQNCVVTEQGTVYFWASKAWEANRETLVFLHGLTADHTMFRPQIDYFKSSYNLIAWDAPAHGASRPYTDFTYPNGAEVLRTILDENRVTSAVLIGQSMGGFLAQSFLLRYPERVRAFVGIDTSPFGEAYYSKADRWWLRQVEWMARLYPLNAMKKAMAKQNAVTPEGRQNMLEMLAPYDKDTLCRLMGIGYAGFLADNRDMEITCPALLLLGDRDKTGKVRQYNRAWAEKTGFPLKIIEHAAHNSNVDNPAAVNQAIEEFLRRV